MPAVQVFAGPTQPVQRVVRPLQPVVPVTDVEVAPAPEPPPVPQRYLPSESIISPPSPPPVLEVTIALGLPREAEGTNHPSVFYTVDKGKLELYTSLGRNRYELRVVSLAGMGRKSGKGAVQSLRVSEDGKTIVVVCNQQVMGQPPVGVESVYALRLDAASTVVQKLTDVNVRDEGHIRSTEISATDLRIHTSRSGTLIYDRRSFQEVISTVWPQNPDMWYVFQPESLGIDHEGNLYSVEDSIKKYSPSGEFLYEINDYNFLGSTPCLSCRPSHIAFDSRNNFYVTDGAGVKKFSPDGHWLASFQLPSGLFPKPFRSYDIAVDPSGVIYVTDVNNFCVHRFDQDGNYRGHFGGEVLSSPKPRLGIVADSKGFLYVADNNYFTIHQFDSLGNHVLEWSWEDPEPYEVYDEIFMLDSADLIYLGHTESGFLRKFDTQGREVTPAWEDPRWFLDRDVVVDGAVDAAGNIYLSSDRAIVKFNAAGRLLESHSSYTRDPSQGFFWPVGAAMALDGTLYVRDENYSLFVFDAQGNRQAVWKLPHDLVPYPLSYTAMAVDGRGHVFLAQQNLLIELDPQGNVLSSLNVPGFPYINSLAVDAQGMLWLQHLGKVMEWDPREGRVIQELRLDEWVRAAMGYYVALDGFSMDRNGNLIMTDPEKGVFVFSAQGALIRHFAFAPHRTPPYGIHHATTLILTGTDPEGNIYVVFDQYGEIQKYSPEGLFIASWGQVGTERGQMLRPIFFGTYPNGDLMVVEHGNNRIQTFLHSAISVLP